MQSEKVSHSQCPCVQILDRKHFHIQDLRNGTPVTKLLQSDEVLFVAPYGTLALKRQRLYILAQSYWYLLLLH